MKPFFFILLIFLAPKGVAAPLSHDEAGLQSDWAAPAWRSALLPGWGQAYNHQTTKAWVWGGLTWGLLGGVVYSYSQGTQALNDYSAATTAASATARYDDADRWAQTNEIFYALFAASYFWTVLDAGLNAPATGAHLGLRWDAKGPQLSAAYRW